MNLNLQKPLAFFDLETTGLNISSDRIVEIAILKVMPGGGELIKTYRLNPEKPIPLESSLLHGIYDEDVKASPTFTQVGAEVAAFLEDADLAGYNSNKFDIPVLMEEFLRAGVDFDLDNRRFVDVQNIFHQMEQRTLKAAYAFYCERPLENAHSAEADVVATYEVLKAQLGRYENTEWEDKTGKKSIPVRNDIDALHLFTNLSKPVDFAGRMVYNEDGLETINFGKHKGRTVEEVFRVEPSYYSWMMQGDFPLYTKKCLEKIWKRYRAKLGQEKKAEEAKGQKAVPTQQQAAPTTKHPVNIPPSTTPKKASPITNDMLQGLKEKFGK